MSDFVYHLPDEKIARYPLEQRDVSKLLVWKAGKMEDATYTGPWLVFFQSPLCSFLITVVLWKQEYYFKNQAEVKLKFFVLNQILQY